MTRIVILLLLVLALASPALATDRIWLKTGDYVDVDAWREVNGVVLYSRYGGEIGVPRADIAKIEKLRALDPDTIVVGGGCPAPQVGDIEPTVLRYLRCSGRSTIKSTITDKRGTLTLYSYHEHGVALEKYWILDGRLVELQVTR